MKSVRALSTLALALYLVVAIADAQPAPYYRVFRGYRRADVPADRFPNILADRFIPAAPATHQRNGLIAYVPALPQAGLPAGTPDEIAIVVYESEEAYRAARQTPEGQAYAALHWEFFEEPAPQTGAVPGKRTRSDTARPFARELEADQPVDVYNRFVDWQAGYTAVFVGARRPEVAPESFASEVGRHVAMVRDAFGPRGMDGYIVVVHTDPVNRTMHEIAFIHWPSREAAEAALATPEGESVRADAARLMDIQMWQEAPTFAGAIAYGQAVNVKFTPRPRPVARARP